MSSPTAHAAPYHPAEPSEKRPKLEHVDVPNAPHEGAPPMGGPPGYYYPPPPGAAGSPGGGMGPPGYAYHPPPHDAYYAPPPHAYGAPPPGAYGAPPQEGSPRGPQGGPPRPAHLPPRLNGGQSFGHPQFQDYVHRPGKAVLPPPAPSNGGPATSSPGTEEEPRTDARSPEGSRNLNAIEERVPSTTEAGPEGSPPGPAAMAGPHPGPPTPSMAGFQGPPTPMHGPGPYGMPPGMPPGMPYGHPGAYPPPSPYHGAPGYPGPPTPHGAPHGPPGMPPQFLSMPGAPPGQSIHPGHEGAWPCEYCGLKFPHWEDCSAHEQSCAAYHGHPAGHFGHPGHYPGMMGKWDGRMQGMSPRRGRKGRKMAPFPNQAHLFADPDAEFVTNADKDTYLLSGANDGESLSDRQCYVRSHFVELFVANADDVAARHSRGAQKLHVGQIGLRCAYCVRLKPRDRAERAVCYPSSISRIYQTVADMQRFHFEGCGAIPPKVLMAYKSLKTTRPRGVGSPQGYWDKSAREIGLVDTENGIQVAENAKGKLEGQKKSLVTGQLAVNDPPAQEGPPPVEDVAVPVKEEQEAIAHSDSAPREVGLPASAVVSSPGSTSTGEAKEVASPGVAATPAPAAEDANILLMLKQTPESPVEEASENVVAV
ncbi:hypothetical protein ACHAXT_008300 [Thalassiosira profunda]